MTHEPPKLDRTELRKFGLLMAVAFAVIACLRWWLRGHAPTAVFVVAGVFFALGILLPIALKPVYKLWMKFALALNWIMTRVLLTIVFYLMITPVALIYRLVSGDPLKRCWDPSATTYWEAPDDQPADIEAYKNQF